MNKQSVGNGKASISAIEKVRIKSSKAAEKKAERQRLASEKARIAAAREKAREQKYKEHAELLRLKREKRKRFYGKLKARLKNRSGGFGYFNIGVVPRVELVCRGDGASVAARLSAENIPVTDFSYGSDGKLRFKIRKKDMRKAVAILDEMCYTYKVGATFGIGRFGAFWLARLGLVLGAVISVVCLNIAYGYVWRVEISGNEKLSDAAISSVLASVGISAGRKKSELSSSAVSAAVSGMDGVADATAEIIGTTLYVYVLESKDYTVREKYAAYDSAFDATVTRIVMRSGTASVKRGDVVKRGDILASGDTYSTAGELLYTGECDAEVYGNVSITIAADISPVVVEYRRTGRSVKKTGIELFGLKLFNTSSPYASYESVVKTANYDVLLPLYVTTYEYCETEPVQIERDIDELAKSFATAKADEMNFVGDFEASYTIKPSVSGLYSVHLFLSGETLISRGIDDYVGGRDAQID